MTRFSKASCRCLVALVCITIASAFLQQAQRSARGFGLHNQKPQRFFSGPEVDLDGAESQSTPEVSRRQDVDVKTYVFGKKGEFRNDAQRAGVDPVRFVGYNVLAIILALGANFGGITSSLLTNIDSAGIVAKSLRLDQLYEIDGFRRFADSEDKYEFVYPGNWEQDRTILMKKLQQQEMPSSLNTRNKYSTDLIGPDIAIGPKSGSIVRSKLNNLSVIKSKILPGFSMKGTLGSPQEAAEFLLKNSIAPPQSGKTWKLVTANEDYKGGSAEPRYIFEYVVQKLDPKDPGSGRLVFNQHSISSVVYKNNYLYTLTVVAPEQDWEERGSDASEIANSFTLSK